MRLTINLLTLKGLCEQSPKCVRKNDHEGKCWPNG